MATTLTAKGKRLRELEAIILANLEEFVRTGQALKEIRDEKLYRESGHRNFVTYCAKRWGWGKDSPKGFSQRGYDYISASERRLLFSRDSRENGMCAVWTMEGMKYLAHLNAEDDDDVELIREIGLAVEAQTAPGKEIPGSLVRKVVAKIAPRSQPKKKKKNKPEQTLGEWIGHRADEILNLCTTLEGVPDDILDWEEHLTKRNTKELVDAIKELDEVIKKIWERLP